MGRTVQISLGLLAFMAVFAIADYVGAYFLILDGTEKKHLKEIWHSFSGALSRLFVKEGASSV